MSGSVAKDMTGKRCGMLTVIERAPNRTDPSGKGVVRWRCVCDCGNERIVDAGALRSGAVKSCGCTRGVPNYVHGMVTTRFKTPKPITVQDKLVIGKTYTIKGRRRQLVGIYNGFARFRDEHGLYECFLFTELEGTVNEVDKR